MPVVSPTQPEFPCIPHFSHSVLFLSLSNPDPMTIGLNSTPVLCGLGRPGVLVLGRSSIGAPAFQRRSGLRCRTARVFCGTNIDRQVRKCSPLLDGDLLPNANALNSSDWKTVPDIWKSSAERFGDRIALVDPYHEPPSKFTYKQLEQEILYFSEGIRVVGVVPDEKLALFADNSCRWLIADQGIMATGAVNVVRGTRSSNEELLQIYNHSESIALVLDSPEFLDRLTDSFIRRVNVRFIVLLWGDKSRVNIDAVKGINIYDYKEIISLGQESRHALLHSLKLGQQYVYETINPEDVATLMYTSGTTGTPKGVMLTHQNLLHQVKNLWDILPAEAGDRFLSMLPTWHAYERASEYFIFTYGIEQVYTSVRNLKEDLPRYQPHYLVSVPLVYETLYSRIQKQISSSSAVRKFIALTLIKISFMYMDAKRVYEGKVLMQKPNQHSAIAVLIDWCRGRIVAAVLWPLHQLGTNLLYNKIRSAIGISKAGISGGGSLPMHIDRFFEAIGVKVQNGYGLTETSPVVAARRPACNNQSATNKVVDKEGWLNTGDIGWIAPQASAGRSRKCGGMLVLEGRAKDTIVLSTGENVEPSELEEAAMRSRVIHQIMVVGQDQRRLGALIVPNKEELMAVAKELSIVTANSSELSKDEITRLINKELKTWTSDCSFQIGPIVIVDEPFTIENGLMTPVMKVRRDQVADRYKEQISNLYK